MLKVKGLNRVQDINEPETILRGDVHTTNTSNLGEALSAVVAEKKEAEKSLNDITQENFATPRVTGIKGLIGKKQNIVIESYGEDEAVRDCITSLAVLLVKEDPLMKGFIRRLRQQYCIKQKPFSFSIDGWSETDKQKIRHIFSEELCGVVDSVDVDSNPNIVSGNLVFSPAAYRFISGQYMEIGVYEIVKEVMKEIATRCKINWNVYRNVVVTTKNGVPKNEFDVVIECEGMFYVIEVKSGKNFGEQQFKEWGSLVDSGREYGIVPNRLLLVDSWLSNEKAGRIEEHCQYYVANMENDTLRKKLLKMISNDL